MNRLIELLAESEAKHTVFQGVAAGYHRHLQELTVMIAACTGGNNKLRMDQQSIKDQDRIIAGQKAFIGGVILFGLRTHILQ